MASREEQADEDVLRAPARLAPEPPYEVKRRLANSQLGAPASPAWDIVDEYVWESFPASDPPQSWAGRDRPPLPQRPR